MVWKISFKDSAKKSFSKLDKQIQSKIVNYLENRISKSVDPRVFAKPLTGSYKNLWRYRVGDYRIICDIKNNEIEIVVLTIGHRSSVYD
jgi:mRNA interferase RelE/StbE